MYNIIIDTHHLFSRWVHMHSGRDKTYLTKPEHKIELIKDVFYSIFMESGRYKGCMNRVIFAVDCKGKSWRKEALAEYKVTRNKDHDFDYALFHQAIDEFCDFSESVGIFVLRYEKAEGDDLIAIASDLLFDNNESTVVITGDSDLRQIIKNDKENIITVFDPDPSRKYHFINEYFHHETAVSERTFEDLIDDEVDNADIKNNILNVVFSSSHKVNPFEALIIKILSGDKGDNVPSTFFKTQKSGKLVSFGKDSAAKLVSKLISNKNVSSHDYIKTLLEDDRERRDIASKILAICNSKDLSKLGEIADNIKRNIKLIYLSKIAYDKLLYTEFAIYISEQLFDMERLTKHKGLLLNFNERLLSNTIYKLDNEYRQDTDSLKY